MLRHDSLLLMDNDAYSTKGLKVHIKNGQWSEGTCVTRFILHNVMVDDKQVFYGLYSEMTKSTVDSNDSTWQPTKRENPKSGNPN